MYLYIIVHAFRLNNEHLSEEGKHLAGVMATRTTWGRTNGIHKRAPTEDRCGDVHTEQIGSTTVMPTYYRIMMAHLQLHYITLSII